MLQKTCVDCGNPISVQAEYRCRKCQHKQLQKVKSTQRIQIVNLCRTGKYTLDYIGKQFGISRERVRQIYKYETGHRYRLYYGHRKEARLEALERSRDEVKFVCAGCKEEVTYRDGKNKQKYCIRCSNLLIKGQRLVSEWVNCNQCGIQFHPLRTNYGVSEKNFCNLEHYHAYRKDHPIPRRRLI